MSYTRRNALGFGVATLAATGLGLRPGGMLNALAQDSMMLSGDAYPTQSGDLIVHPINHASVVLAGGGKTIYVDPIGESALYDGLPKPDLILVTHEHGDHFNAETLAALVAENTRIITNPAVFGMLPADLKAISTSLANGESGEGAGLAIDAIPAYNTTADRLQFHPKGRDNGYIVTIDGIRVYLAGDTEDIPEMRALTDIEVAFIPMNLPYTMDEAQAASGVIAFAPKHVYPYHYRGSDLEKFKTLVNAGNSSINVHFADWY